MCRVWCFTIWFGIPLWPSTQLWPNDVLQASHGWWLEHDFDPNKLFPGDGVSRIRLEIFKTARAVYHIAYAPRIHPTFGVAPSLFEIQDVPRVIRCIEVWAWNCLFSAGHTSWVARSCNVVQIVLPPNWEPKFWIFVWLQNYLARKMGRVALPIVLWFPDYFNNSNWNFAAVGMPLPAAFCKCLGLGAFAAHHVAFEDCRLRHAFGQNFVDGLLLLPFDGWAVAAIGR